MISRNTMTQRIVSVRRHHDLPTFKRCRAALAALALVIIASCSGVESEAVYPRKDGNKAVPAPAGERDTVFGPGGLSLFGGGEGGGGGGGGGIGVNSFLWRASLDTTSFMPLSSADPFGGVIITDWYSPPDVPDERFKMTVYILDRRLRADGIKVAVFRQRRDPTKSWVDEPVNKLTSTNLENAILTRARQMRMEFIEEEE